MTRRRRRLYFILSSMAMLGVATALMLNAFSESLVFFHSPSEIAEKGIPAERRFRLGGLVEENSVEKANDGVTISFRVTDTAVSVPVRYRGLLPDLFREGQGVVADGALDGSGTFVATEILAKHDETYMPPEVAEALKKAGQWQGEETDDR
ncbi:MAG: cytochrome c maturation protein CcmE [Alphaproteobacteria bacterium]|nr:cytochrome c maturation protein CcmE [Alphaproteobacteria bacterium]|tara:strand:- start:4861 stop:5313 length:453 start_codon:yes stop_codon:yes gene_type:complete